MSLAHELTDTFGGAVATNTGCIHYWPKEGKEEEVQSYLNSRKLFSWDGAGFKHVAENQKELCKRPRSHFEKPKQEETEAEEPQKEDTIEE